MLSSRNQHAPEGPVETWPMSFVLEVLDRGSAEDWISIIQAIRQNPNSPFVLRLEQALRHTYMYGTSALFLTLIARSRGEEENPAAFPKPPDETSEKPSPARRRWTVGQSPKREPRRFTTSAPRISGPTFDTLFPESLAGQGLEDAKGWRSTTPPHFRMFGFPQRSMRVT